MQTFYIETFGCQMNVHDSEKVAGVLAARGYRAVGTPEEADLVLYNTCSIRDKAEQKVYSRLQQFKRSSGGKTFAVLGCVAQQEGERIFERAPHVSLVCGSASYNRLPTLLDQVEAGGKRVTGLHLDTEETFETPFARRDNPHRAYITIMEGCSKHCAYCVVPHTRGPERSRTAASIVAEARKLAGDGYTEIQLLGQNVNSYRDPEDDATTFAPLLAALSGVAGLRRVRFTTSHPKDFGRDIVETIDAHTVLANHVHLPVQSGSDHVLERMQRLYTRAEYMQRIGWLKASPREISITTDIIVGFPGESEDDFQDTLALLDEVEYDSLFSFKYSPRPNTPALELDGQVPETEKAARLSALQEKQRAIQMRRNAALVGSVEEVLVEGYNQATGQWIGRTPQNRILNFLHPSDGGVSLVGRYARVRVTRAGPNSLAGESANLL
jgi:tRNA-2-methylthio-N6-dimethylallyladenosine synthase